MRMMRVHICDACCVLSVCFVRVGVHREHRVGDARAVVAREVSRARSRCNRARRRKVVF